MDLQLQFILLSYGCDFQNGALLLVCRLLPWWLQKIPFQALVRDERFGECLFWSKFVAMIPIWNLDLSFAHLSNISSTSFDSSWFHYQPMHLNLFDTPCLLLISSLFSTLKCSHTQFTGNVLIYSISNLFLQCMGFWLHLQSLHSHLVCSHLFYQNTIATLDIIIKYC